ncbi:MAG: late competence development ComFB family protein [Methylocystaceae bacterium]
MVKLCNTTEIIAEQTLEQIVLSKMIDDVPITSFCFCPRCWADVLSLALNNLPPRYVVSETGEVITRAHMTTDYQMQANVYAEVMKALLQVGAHPHHDIQLLELNEEVLKNEE